MRPVAIICAIVLISGFASAQVNGQATVEGGYASTWIVPPGAYAVPLVPLVVTPTYDFGTPSLQVGASNATSGNVAGAANSTLSVETHSAYSVFTPFYAPGVALFSSSLSSGSNSEENAGTRELQRTSLDLGGATFQSDYSAAELANSRSQAHAAKTYTNDDLNHLNQNNGEVKFGNKTEHLD